MSERIEAIRRAVEVMHECEAVHVSSVPVRETFNGAVVWEGVVETFDISGCPDARRCYAWQVPEKNDQDPGTFVGVLEKPPVKDALTAVRASIMAARKSDRV